MDLDRETTVKRDRLQGHLSEGDALLPRRHGEPPRHTDHRQRQYAQNRCDFLLLRQRGDLHHRKRRAHRPARAGEAKKGHGAAEGEVKGEYANSQDRNWRLSWYRIGAVPVKDTIIREDSMKKSGTGHREGCLVLDFLL